MERRQHWTRGRAAGALACLALAWLLAGHALAGPKWGAGYFPNTVLTTQDGVAVRFYDDLLKGKAVAVNLIYTKSADVCPLETARMAEVQRLLGDRVGKDIFFYSISIDPEHDTPAVLKAYAAKFGAGPGWLFLTGNKEDIKLLSRKLGLSRSSDPQSKDGHASSLMIGIEPAGQWMLNSAVDNPRFLASTIRNFNGWPDPLAARDYAQARPLEVSRAQYTFESRCASCHSIGGGERIGPDLLAVTRRRDPRWLARYLREPDKVLAEGDPIATSLFEKYRRVAMPNLRLGDEDIAQLIAYLDAQGKARQTGAAPQHLHHEH
jgi:protein SCO1/2